MSLKSQRIQLKEIEADAVRFLCGPYVRLGDVEKNSTTITVLRTGNFSHPKYGRFSITLEDLEGMVRNFDNRTYGQDIQLDVAHKPEDGNAADFKGLFIAGNRLRARVELTEYGLEAIRKRGFKYISADFAHNWTDHEFEKAHGPVLFGAALVTRPFVKNMEPVQLSEEGGKSIITFIHPDTIKHLEEENMKKLLDALKQKLQSLKLSEDQINQFIQLFENTAKQFKDNEDALKQLSEGIENQAKQLADVLADKTRDPVAPIQLGDITIRAGGNEDLDSIIAKKLAEAAEEKAKQLADATAALEANQKIFDDAIEAAEGLSEETVKTLNEQRDLITGEMTEDQVKRFSESQINMGNKLEASKQLGSLGYPMPGAAGSVHIQMGDSQESLQLQEEINTGLRGTSSASRLVLAAEDKLSPFVGQVLQLFDAQHARQLHQERKLLAAGEVDMASTNLPVGFKRTVIREALSDLRVLELVETMTDPLATVTTQIPYEERDMSQIENDGIVYEGNGIPPAGVVQKMDTAYIRAMKISLKISNEVIHFSNASGINWNAYGRTVESNARIMKELIVRRICNELQRSSDTYLSADVTAEVFDAQMGKASGIIKTVNFPIVRPHQERDLQGNVVGDLENGITLTLNGAVIAAFDGTGKQSAGTYYKVSNYNQGFVQLCDETGAAVPLPADSGVNTISYSYSGNIVKFDLDVPANTKLEVHLNGLLQKFGERKAVMADDRFVTPDFSLMSNTMNENCVNAEQFSESGSRADSSISAMGDLQPVKSIGAWKTNAPGVDLGDDRILIGQRGTLAYTIAKAFATGAPFEAVDDNGRPTGEKVAYGEEYSSIKAPVPIRNRFTSIIAYSVTARAAA